MYYRQRREKGDMMTVNLKHHRQHCRQRWRVRGMSGMRGREGYLVR
jgi:hypothetical protein